GFAYYLTFSNYIHDDESVIPYPDQNYIFKLYKMFKTSKGLIELKDLLLLDRKLFYKKKKYTFPQSWSLVRFFMDVYPEGRKILKNYYRESADANEFSDVEDQSYEKVFHNKRTDSWSNYDVIWEKYSEWFNKIEEPKGFEYYLKAKEALTFKTKTENLEIAISLNPTYARYYSAISKVYLDEPDFEKSLEYSEKAIKLQLTNKQALEVAIISAFRLEKFSVSEFYFKIYEEFYELSEDMKELKKTVQDWRGTNPELPHYSHLNEDVEVFINPK
ncbi:MAG: hypothetical protein KDK36_12040, partial [Leptospiraceae bacterium]|nr:hypothetical protein [Leptospiraceae bacterium]